jgi:hypothetical protein
MAGKTIPSTALPLFDAQKAVFLGQAGSSPGYRFDPGTIGLIIPQGGSSVIA